MNTPSIHLVLLAVVALFCTLVGAAVGLLARLDGATYATALLRGAVAFAGSATLSGPASASGREYIRHVSSCFLAAMCLWSCHTVYRERDGGVLATGAAPRRLGRQRHRLRRVRGVRRVDILTSSLCR